MSSHELLPDGYEYELPEYIDFLFRAGEWNRQKKEPDQEVSSANEPLTADSSLYAGVAEVMLRTGMGKIDIDSDNYPLPDLEPLKPDMQVRILHSLGTHVAKKVKELAAYSHLLKKDISIKKQEQWTYLSLKTPQSKDFPFVTFTVMDRPISIIGNPRLVTSHVLTVGGWRDAQEQVMAEAEYYRKHGTQAPHPLTDRFSYYFSKNGESHVLYEPALTIEAIEKGAYSMPIESMQLQAMGATVPKKAMMKVWNTVMPYH